MTKDQWQSPFKLEIGLSENAEVVQAFDNYTFIDLLIALGGISRSFYIMGMVCAHSVAKLLYRKALMENLFMWQKKRSKPNPRYLGTSLKKSRKLLQ